MVRQKKGPWQPPGAFFTPRASPFDKLRASSFGVAQDKIPRRIFFEVEFPIFPYRISRGENRISLNPIEIPSKPYVNPILVALEYQEALKRPEVNNQAELAKSLNITRSRINQYLRLLKLPETIQEDVRSSRVKATQRNLRRIMAVR